MRGPNRPVKELALNKAVTVFGIWRSIQGYQETVAQVWNFFDDRKGDGK